MEKLRLNDGTELENASAILVEPDLFLYVNGTTMGALFYQVNDILIFDALVDARGGDHGAGQDQEGQRHDQHGGQRLADGFAPAGNQLVLDHILSSDAARCTSLLTSDHVTTVRVTGTWMSS